MEHSRILPPDTIDTLAVHGLRELCFAPIPKVARALSGFNREQLGTAIEVMIAMLDAADDDPDVEPSGDDEPNGDDLGDQAYLEWHTVPSNLKRHGQPGILAGHEDDEEDDAPEEDDPSGQCDEDEINTNLHAQWAIGAGCRISDEGGCDLER